MIAKYFRFGLAVFVLYPITWAAILLGGWWLLLPVAVIFGGHVIFDNLTPLDEDSYADLRPRLADLWLYAHVPCAIVTMTLMLWQAAPGDMLGLGALLAQWFGPRIWQAHVSYDITQFLLCAYVGGLMLSTNTVVAHELVHRRDWLPLLVGRWLLALNGDAQFSISHVYGHHFNVATPKDPATARRGESVYHFFVRSSIGQYTESVELEARRLERLGYAFWSWRNHLIQSVLMTALLAVIAFGLAGINGLAMFVLSCVVVKFLFENVNYIQHYGLLRTPGQRVEPRHSWDCSNRGSTWVFYALSRHSHHHAKPILPYWELVSAAPEVSPKLELGYLASMVLSMIPPLWFRWTTPRLLDWDCRLASDEERALAHAANRISNYPPLIAASG